MTIFNSHLNNSDSLKQYEAEEIDGTSLDIKESFNFVQPSCPNIDEDGKFEDFTCFDYLEDTVLTKQETSTTTTRASTDAAIPPMHIAIFSGLGAALFLVIIAIVIYKIRKGK